jgi:alpha-glucosidase
MFYNKFPHPANFVFADGFDPKTGEVTAGKHRFAASIESFAGDVHRIRLDQHGKRYPATLTEFTPPEEAGRGKLKVGHNLALDLAGLLISPESRTFGVSGDAWMFCLQTSPEALFFGLGEKYYGRMEVSGIRTTFWNTDVWSDFHFAHWENHTADPPYFSTPYLIVKVGEEYVGILVSTPFPAYFEVPGTETTRVFVEWQRTSEALIFGALGGQPDIWLISGPSLKELTQKLQSLVGKTPLPPQWSLGYHQSKWGYAGETDLLGLDANFTESKTPCDGLWLDIDYMNGYRVFSVDESLFPGGLKRAAKKLSRKNRHIVPILDPGIKQDASYAIYQEGSAKGHFCLNPEGQEYVGLVWPGETVFPDFMQAKTRKWWANHVKTIAKQGLDGCWVDMNDPSTGPVNPDDMLFNRGRDSHAAHRNEYALGMQMATFDGFRMAQSNRRPFILSRSGYTGSSRYAAIWSGDNYANYWHLRMSIPCALNMSLSGLPFNGTDIGGFGGQPTDQLLTDWFKAQFLFPVFRNHADRGQRPKEHWNQVSGTQTVMRRYIRLRYKLMPYLVNLFMDQETSGDPILRPLMYEFAADRELARVSDQFMVGPAVLQAPVVDETKRERDVVLPGGGAWLDANHGEWVTDAVRTVHPGHAETPLYIRAGSVIPMTEGLPTETGQDLRQVELHLFIEPGSTGETSYLYRADDGFTYDYQRGIRSAIELRASWTDKQLKLDTRVISETYGSIEAVIVVHGGPAKVTLNGRNGQLSEHSLTLTGGPFEGVRVD